MIYIRVRPGLITLSLYYMTLWINNLIPEKPHCCWRMVSFQINDCNGLIRWKKKGLPEARKWLSIFTGNLLNAPLLRSPLWCYSAAADWQPHWVCSWNTASSGFLWGTIPSVIFHPRSLAIITDLSVASTISLPLHQMNPTGSYVRTKHLPRNRRCLVSKCCDLCSLFVHSWQHTNQTQHQGAVI